MISTLHSIYRISGSGLYEICCKDPVIFSLDNRLEENFKFFITYRLSIYLSRLSNYYRLSPKESLLFTQCMQLDFGNLTFIEGKYGFISILYAY